MRPRTLLPWITLGLLLGAIAAGLALNPPHTATAAPDVFASPINAGCTQPSPGVCKLHVDPFTLQVAGSNRLQALQLRANGTLLYDFRTDVSNPPPGNYTPSSVKLDFAATCGVTYTINLLARDSGDTSFLNAGQVENVACPVFDFPGPSLANAVMLPLMLR